MRTVIRCLVSAVLLAGATAYAQTASIAGTIADPSGAGVPRATVRAKNLGKASVRKGTTSDTGTYSIPNLPAGTYDVSVKKQGFSILQFRNIQLTVAQILS